MQTVTITLQIPDGVTVAVATTQGPAAIPATPVDPSAPKFEDVKRAFVAAVGRNKVEGLAVCQGFLTAEQVNTLQAFPATRYAELIAKFEGVK